MAEQADREFTCKYCHNVITIKSKWNKNEIMCSCGQLIDLKLDYNNDGKNKKLNNSASKDWTDNRVAKVPKASTSKLGGRIVKLPNMTGVNNVKRDQKDQKEKDKKKKKEKQSLKKKQDK
eukprot:281746_1